MCYKENYKKHEEMSAFFQYHGKFLEIWTFIRWQCFFGLFFVRVSLIYRGQSRKRWGRGREKKGRRQLIMILHMRHSFCSLFFLPSLHDNDFFFFPLFPKSVPGEFDYISDKLIV